VKQALLIAGPTASGKSALSLRLAKDLNGVVINADSMQVYDGMRVLTACPSVEDEQAAPHKLYRFLDAEETCSAAFWAAQAMAEIESAWQAGQVPIVIGGTGMYFKVLLEGIAHIPDIDTAVRETVRAECDEKGSEHLHKELAIADSVIAERLSPNDSQRVCRAVEVYRSTGKALSQWHRDTEPGLLQAADTAGFVNKLVLSPEREELYERCNRRFDIMLSEGAIDEVKALMQRSLPTSLPAMRALGVPQLIMYLQGKHNLDEVSEEAKMQTRRFAKRQLTWFRNQFSEWEKLFTQYSERKYDEIVSKNS